MTQLIQEVKMEQQTNNINAANSQNQPAVYDFLTYPRQFVTYKWFKPILVALLTAVISMAFSLVLLAIGRVWSGDPGFIQAVQGGYDSINFADGPYVLVMQGGLASVLIALALAAIIVKDRPFSSYASSRGGWNWSAFLKCLGLCLPVYVVLGILSYVLSPPETIQWRFTLSGLILTLLLTPLQCVAEEFLFRGFLSQTIGAWTKKPVIGIVISAIFFMTAHPYNIFGAVEIFFCGLILGFLSWKTQGIEATGAIHVLNNMMSFLMAGMGLASIKAEVDMTSALLEIAAYVTAAALVIFVADKKFGWFTALGDDVVAYNTRMAEKQREKATK